MDKISDEVREMMDKHNLTQGQAEDLVADKKNFEKKLLERKRKNND